MSFMVLSNLACGWRIRIVAQHAERFPQGVSRIVQMPSNCGLRELQCLTDISRRPPFDFVQHDDLSLTIGQRRDGRIEPILNLTALGLDIGPGVVRRRVLR